MSPTGLCNDPGDYESGNTPLPNEKGFLSADEVHKCNTRFTEYEKAQGRDLKCEVCGNIKWTLNPRVLALPGDSEKGILGSASKTPVINYFCVVCGNMKFFSAIYWGTALPVETPRGD